MKILRLVPRWLLLIVLLLAVVAGVATVVVVTSSRAPSGNTTDSTNPDQTGDPDQPRTDVVSPEDIREFRYAAITTEDTIVGVDKDTNEEIVINLDRREWKNILWSPGGRYISVLGISDRNKSDIYDLFIFDTDTNNWEQVTDYGVLDSGVTGYTWMPDLHILFSQGTMNSSWVHEYDVVDKELLKKFKISGVIIGGIPSQQQVIIESPRKLDLINLGMGEVDDTAYLIYARSGSEIRSFGAFSSARIIGSFEDIIVSRKDQEFIFETIKYPTGDATYIWSFNNPTFRQIYKQSDPNDLVKILCSTDDRLLWSLRRRDGVVWWGSFNPDTDSFAAVQSVPELSTVNSSILNGAKMNCGAIDNLITFKVGLNNQIEVFRLEQGRIEKLEFKNKFVEITPKLGD